MAEKDIIAAGLSKETKPEHLAALFQYAKDKDPNLLVLFGMQEFPLGARRKQDLERCVAVINAKRNEAALRAGEGISHQRYLLDFLSQQQQLTGQIGDAYTVYMQITQEILEMKYKWYASIHDAVREQGLDVPMLFVAGPNDVPVMETFKEISPLSTLPADSWREVDRILPRGDIKSRARDAVESIGHNYRGMFFNILVLGGLLFPDKDGRKAVDCHLFELPSIVEGDGHTLKTELSRDDYFAILSNTPARSTYEEEVNPYVTLNDVLDSNYQRIIMHPTAFANFAAHKGNNSKLGISTGILADTPAAHHPLVFSRLQVFDSGKTLVTCLQLSPDCSEAVEAKQEELPAGGSSLINRLPNRLRAYEATPEPVTLHTAHHLPGAEQMVAEYEVRRHLRTKRKWGVAKALFYAVSLGFVAWLAHYNSGKQNTVLTEQIAKIQSTNAKLAGEVTALRAMPAVTPIINVVREEKSFVARDYTAQYWRKSRQLETKLEIALIGLKDEEGRLRERRKRNPKLLRSFTQAGNDIASGITFGAVPNYDKGKPQGAGRIGYSLRKVGKGLLRVPYGAFNSIRYAGEDETKGVRKKMDKLSALRKGLREHLSSRSYDTYNRIEIRDIPAKKRNFELFE